MSSAIGILSLAKVSNTKGRRIKGAKAIIDFISLFLCPLVFGSGLPALRVLNHESFRLFRDRERVHRAGASDGLVQCRYPGYSKSVAITYHASNLGRGERVDRESAPDAESQAHRSSSVCVSGLH